MNFLAPIYFWTLLGLTIPLLIHLWNRKKIKTIKIGSVQLLKDSNPKQSRSFRLNEWVLLFLRMLLIGLLTLLLVGPVIKKSVSKTELTVIIEPELITSDEFSSFFDTLSFPEIRLLQPGLPIYEEGTEVDSFSQPNYWQLALDMEELAADSIIVYSYGQVSGIKGIRPSLSDRIDWILIPSYGTNKKYLSAQEKGDSIEFLIANSDDQLLTISKENVSSSNNQVELNESGDSILFLSGNRENLLLKPETNFEAAIIYDEETKETMELCKASLHAMGEYLDQNIKIQSAGNYEEIAKLNYDLVIFLTQEPINSKTKKKLIYKPDSTAQQLIVPGKDKTTYLLTQKLRTYEVLRSHFPERLWKIMTEDTDLSRKIDLADGRQMDLSLLKPRMIQKEYKAESFQEMKISPWLWVFFIMIFAVERILSKVRKQ